MADTNIFQNRRSRRVPIIAGAILLALIVALALYRYAPFGAKLPGVQDQPAGTAQAKDGAKPASAGAASTAAAKPAAAPAAPPTPVRVALVKESLVVDDITAVGSLLADESVVIRPEIAGRIVKIHFNEGQAREAGALLVTMDTAVMRSAARADRG